MSRKIPDTRAAIRMPTRASTIVTPVRERLSLRYLVPFSRLFLGDGIFTCCSDILSYCLMLSMPIVVSCVALSPMCMALSEH